MNLQPCPRKGDRVIHENVGQQAHECREQAQAAQIELLTHRLVEARMVIEQQAKYIVDQERRLREKNG